MRTFPVISTKYEHVNNFINTLAPVVCNAWIKYRREEKKTISPAVILAQAARIWLEFRGCFTFWN